MSTTSTPIVLNVDNWDTTSIKYMAPKLNDRGGKSIAMISRQTNRSLHISTPLLMSWGINDWVDDKGDSDGKFSISLNFPNPEYSNAKTDLFLSKLTAFENQILDDAVKNSELWWGEDMSREVAKHTFFPFIKYSKIKDSKKIDTSKPPAFRAKVPNYNGKWTVEIYDTKQNLLFPAANEHLTPVDFVPKMSSVACVLQCGGIWIGGKGWGLTWKLIQCVVKPREVISVYGKCQIQLSAEDEDTLLSQQDINDIEECKPVVALTTKKTATAVLAPTPVSTFVEDSDDDNDAPLATELVVPVVVPVAPAPIKKRVVKKPVDVVLTSVPQVSSSETVFDVVNTTTSELAEVLQQTEIAVDTTVEAPKVKKILKKKVV
jgi:hypothetical protein